MCICANISSRGPFTPGLFTLIHLTLSTQNNFFMNLKCRLNTLWENPSFPLRLS